MFTILADISLLGLEKFCNAEVTITTSVVAVIIISKLEKQEFDGAVTVRSCCGGFFLAQNGLR